MKNKKIKLIIVIIMLLSILLPSIIVPAIAEPSDQEIELYFKDAKIKQGETEATLELKTNTAATFMSFQADFGTTGSNSGIKLKELISHSLVSPMENNSENGHVLYSETNYDSGGAVLQKDGTFWTAKYTIPENIPVGEYTVNLDVEAYAFVLNGEEWVDRESSATNRIIITGKIIVEEDVTPITDNSVSVSLSYDSTVYDGSEKTPSVTVKKNEAVLDNSNYTVSYNNNVNAGTANVVITGKNKLSGSITKAFRITPAELGSAELEYTSTEYTGEEKKPAVTVYDKNNKEVTSDNYSVSYSNNIEASTEENASVTITGKNNYSGSITKEFRITFNVTPSHVHDLVYEQRKEATCTEDGRVEYWYCELCGKYFTDDAAVNEIDNIVIPKTGHAWGDPIWSWEEFNSAAATFTCSNDESHKEELNAEISSSRTEPSCEKDGSIEYTATVMFNDKEYKDTKTDILNKLGHTWEFDKFIWEDKDGSRAAVAKYICTNNEEHTETVDADITSNSENASCETPGKVTYTATVDETKSLDKKKHTEDKVVEGESLGHSYVFNKWVWADDFSYAEAEFVCDNDKEHKHTVKVSSTNVEVEPTCTENGSITYEVKLDFEGNEYSDSKEVVGKTATGHKWGEWQEITAPTCDSAGKRRRECEHNSEHFEEEDIDKLLHEMEEIDKKDPTCEKAGNIEYYICKHCNKWFFDKDGASEIENHDDVVLPRTDHDWGEWETINEPTEETEGLKRRICKNNHDHYEEEKIDKLYPTPIENPEEEIFKIIFNLNGGTIEGKEEYAVKGKKDTIIILPLPEKEGFIFDYWEGSRYSAGDEYIISENHTLTAIWKEKEEDNSQNNEENNSNNTNEPTNDSENSSNNTNEQTNNSKDSDSLSNNTSQKNDTPTNTELTANKINNQQRALDSVKTNSSNTKEPVAKASAVKTSDNSNISYMFALFILSSLLLVATSLKRRVYKN